MNAMTRRERPRKIDTLEFFNDSTTKNLGSEKKSPRGRRRKIYLHSQEDSTKKTLLRKFTRQKCPHINNNIITA